MEISVSVEEFDCLWDTNSKSVRYGILLGIFPSFHSGIPQMFHKQCYLPVLRIEKWKERESIQGVNNAINFFIGKLEINVQFWIKI